MGRIAGVWKAIWNGAIRYTTLRLPPWLPTLGLRLPQRLGLGLLLCSLTSVSHAFTGAWTGAPLNLPQPTVDSYDWGDQYNYAFGVINSSFTVMASTGSCTGVNFVQALASGNITCAQPSNVTGTAAALATTPSLAASGDLCRGVDTGANCVRAATDSSAVSASTNPIQSGALFTHAALTGTSAHSAASANTASMIVARDVSGNFSAGTITATLSGNSTTATTATNIAGGGARLVHVQTAAGVTGFTADPGSNGYVIGGGTGTIGGTTNQIVATQTNANLVLSTPQDINTISTPTFSQVILSSVVTTVNVDATGVYYAANGSATAPTFAAKLNPNSGLFFNGSTVQATVAGTARMSINGQGITSCTSNGCAVTGGSVGTAIAPAFNFGGGTSTNDAKTGLGWLNTGRMVLISSANTVAIIESTGATSPTSVTFLATSSVTFAGPTLSSGTLSFGSNFVEAVSSIAASGANLTVSFTSSTIISITLTGNTAITFNNAVAGTSVTLILKEDGTGSRIPTWPAGVRWAGGSAPTLTTTAGKADFITIFYDGVQYWGLTGPANL